MLVERQYITQSQGTRGVGSNAAMAQWSEHLPTLPDFHRLGVTRI